MDRRVTEGAVSEERPYFEGLSPQSEADLSGAPSLAGSVPELSALRLRLVGGWESGELYTLRRRRQWHYGCTQRCMLACSGSYWAVRLCMCCKPINTRAPSCLPTPPCIPPPARHAQDGRVSPGQGSRPQGAVSPHTRPKQGGWGRTLHHGPTRLSWISRLLVTASLQLLFMLMLCQTSSAITLWSVASLAALVSPVPTHSAHTHARTRTHIHTRAHTPAHTPARVPRPAQVAVCPRWLAGSCRAGESACPLQHRRVPDLMPLCSFFLQVGV